MNFFRIGTVHQQSVTGRSATELPQASPKMYYAKSKGLKM